MAQYRFGGLAGQNELKKEPSINIFSNKPREYTPEEVFVEQSECDSPISPIRPRKLLEERKSPVPQLPKLKLLK